MRYRGVEVEMALVLLVERDVHLRGNRGPLRIGRGADELRGLDRDLQRFARRGIGERVVRHVVVGLVGRGDVVDLVAVLRLVVGDPADPELRDLADHRPAMLLQPGAVARGEVVLPLRDRDVGVDVDLAEHAVGEVRRVVDAGLGIGFPRIHRAFHAVLFRAIACRLHRAVAEHHDRLGAFRMQQEQGGEHPRIAVPERVAGVARGQRAGTHRPGRAHRGVGQQVVQVRMHGALHVRIAVDHDVGFPQRVPGGLVFGEQRGEALLARSTGQRHIVAGVAAPVLPRRGDVLGEDVGPALLHRGGEVERQLVRAFFQLHAFDREAGRQADRRGFGHRQAVFGAAVQPQRQFLGVAVAGQHAGVARIPHGGAVGRRHRLVVQRLAAGDHRGDHLVAAHAGDREARLMFRPQPDREGQLHAAIELRRDGELCRRQVVGGLADERGDLDVGRLVRVREAVAGRQRTVVHVQRLRVVGEDLPVDPGRIEPAAAGVVVDLAPAGDRGGARDVARLVIHERDHVRAVALGAAHRGHRGEITVGQVAREIRAEIFRRAGEQEAGVGGGAGAGAGQQQAEREAGKQVAA